jgi:predicted RecA/RadA family phage recombinase
MTQTAAKRVTSRGDEIDYTPTSAVAAGDVVQIGSIPMVATQAINANEAGTVSCEGVFDLPKTTDVFTAGDAVYWNSAGTDVGANTGAADNATGNIAGVCVENAATGATHVRTKLTAAKRTNTIAGSVTADGITGSDSSLGITGMAGNASAGGIVAIAGGAGDDTNAGGAVTIVGGAGAANAGDGAAVTITGGAATANNDNGGAVTINGGAKHGTGEDGAISIGVTNAASITLGKMPRVPMAGATAAGGNIATAGALAEGWNLVAASDNAKGVQLPSCVNGARCVVINMVTDKTLLIYPPLAKQVNLKGANNAITVAANTISYFVSEGTNAWYGHTSAADVA